MLAAIVADATSKRRWECVPNQTEVGKSGANVRGFSRSDRRFNLIWSRRVKCTRAAASTGARTDHGQVALLDGAELDAAKEHQRLVEALTLAAEAAGLDWSDRRARRSPPVVT